MPHRPLVNLIHWQIALVSEKKLQRTLQFAALGFDVSFQEIFSTLCAGAVLALINHDIRLNPAKLFDHICTNGIQRLYLPYVALQAVAEAAICIDEEEFEKPKCVLEDIITAGEQRPAVQHKANTTDRKSTRLNSSHTVISYAVFFL